MAFISRRGILQGSAAIGFTSATGLLGGMGRAYAADTSGYKALVCLFLKGGMDSVDTVLPTDAESHSALAEARKDVFASYRVGSGESSRDIENILGLNSARDFGGRTFGLPRELSPLHDLYTSGRMAVVGNVGPLNEPTTRDQMDRQLVDVPPRLFSHNDQQSLWMSGGLEGQRFGWGGAFADRVAPVSGLGRTFASVTAGPPEGFLNADRTKQYPGRLNGPVKLEVLDNIYRVGRDRDAARARLAEHFASTSVASDNVFRRDLAASNAVTQSNNATFKEAIVGATEFTTVFPGSNVGKQLQTIAKIISIRGTLGASRQVFYAEQTGYDTHNDQSGNLPQRHTELAEAVLAFNAAMVELGLDESVTLFTGTDFGRTGLGNGNGTDHGWGSHQFVVGGAVKGGEIYGDIPPNDFGLQNYTRSRGRLIPDVSVDQYASTLGRWFGLADDEMADALPNLGSFASKDLGFMGAGAS